MFMIIMQGVPGSGKSYLANVIKMGHPDAELQICSTDQFWAIHQIPFTVSRLWEAHEWNQERVASCVANDVSVIVDNTNIYAWEAKPYVVMAWACKVPVYFIRCTGRFQNVHGVPDTIVQRMLANMEPLTIEACLAAERPARKEPPK